MSSRSSILKDEELEKAFAADPDAAVSLLHQKYRVLIARYIKSISKGQLRPEELGDVYQETLLSVLKATRRPEFDTQAPMRLVLRIARCRALDALRRKGQQPQDIDWDQQCSKPDENRKPEQREFRAAYSNAIKKLSTRQNLIARIFMEHAGQLDQRGKYDFIKARVTDLTGETVSVAAIKSAWQAARKKIKKELAGSGFSTEGGHDDHE
ncbi:MAG: sigma-70 family RNA polymerase sigma factor [Planctomycetota bacterium]|nr:sigma-70 family RNA polymerase sigma factor [Planctomycetota bacterium]